PRALYASGDSGCLRRGQSRERPRAGPRKSRPSRPIPPPPLRSTEPGDCPIMTETTRLDCRCGRVHLELRGAPILSTECCCNSCREAAERLRKLPGAPMLVTAHGATHFVL